MGLLGSPRRFALAVTGIACAILLAGCAECRWPRIDPTGERVFVPAPEPENPLYKELPAGQLSWDPVEVLLTPRAIAAPVGSEVVLLVGVRGPDNYLRTNERVEWSISAGSVGQFVELDKGTYWDLLVGDFTWPRKISPTSAVGSTSRRYLRLTRGTPTPADDVLVASGQTWITVTSPMEGSTYVTAYAREVYGWDRHKQSAVIHWIDAQWRFPPVAIVPAGGRQVLTTTVTRQSDQSPAVGWRVRYTISGGPPAGFVPSGAQTVEVETNASGQASVEILQRQPAAGTNRVDIQVSRPAQAGAPAGTLAVLGSGSTMVTWSAPGIAPTVPPAAAVPPFVGPGVPGARPSLEIKTAGPERATVGDKVQFNITLINRGQTTATGLSATDTFDPGLVNEKAPGRNAVTYSLADYDLPPGEALELRVDFVVTKAGRLCHTVEVTGAGGLRAISQSCVTAVEAGAKVPSGPPAAARTFPPPAATGRLTVKMSADAATATVGQRVSLYIDVTNEGLQPLTGVKVSAMLDPALKALVATENFQKDTAGLFWNLSSLAPGQPYRFEIRCQCVQPVAQAYLRAQVTSQQGVQGEDGLWLPIRAAGPGTPNTSGMPGAEGPPGTSALRVSVKTLYEPIAVGRDLTYTVRVDNTSATAEARDVAVSVEVPPEMVPVPFGTTGPTTPMPKGQVVTFEPKSRVLPGDSLEYRVRVRAIKPGKIRIQAKVTSQSLREPQVAEAWTTVVEG